MNPKNNSILTEDGQRLTVENDEITGTEDTGPGLAYETGNTLLNEGVNTEAKEVKKEEVDKEEKK